MRIIKEIVKFVQRKIWVQAIRRGWRIGNKPDWFLRIWHWAHDSVWPRPSVYKKWYVDGQWTNERARAHQEWDLNLSALACGRVCGKDVDGCCPFPFELDQEYWLKEGRLPIFSSYARRRWTPKFGDTEDLFDAGFIPSHFTGTQKYTINKSITGWIAHRNYDF